MYQTKQNHQGDVIFDKKAAQAGAAAGVVHRVFSDGTAIINLAGGGVVRASAEVIGENYKLAVGQAVRVDVAPDGENAASISLA